ncbi:RDD family protein [Kribbella pittospori]|uniref:RDD family protein n=1 Tax=Kribbella pittospori TaxID=722689 RepID=A0A4R0KBB5_9ACTN|nr:RDD family protein [Kribbella pittospori]TCC57611.1 RDD family protein [Kribbella pittospori]
MVTRRRLAWLRITAWVVDWLCILVLAVMLVPIGLVVHGLELPVWALNLGSFLLLVLPATLWLAWRESARGATPGKRLRGLMVVSARTGRQVSFRRALARNALKVTVPWELGHTVAYGFATEADPGAWLIVVSIVLYAVVLVWIAGLFARVSPYDALAGTRVVLTSGDQNIS